MEKKRNLLVTMPRKSDLSWAKLKRGNHGSRLMQQVKQNPLALYIHVPFCRQRCAYCHFDIKVLHPNTPFQPWAARYLKALCDEIDFYGAQFGSRPIGSIFFGGGTPSRLGIKEIEALLNKVQSQFQLAPNAEISIEANPEDVKDGVLNEWQQLGINRVSFGVQTFNDQGLNAIRRYHTATDARTSMAHRPEFSNGVSLDLMLGLPHQTTQTLMHDLHILEELGLQHVSVYMLERDLPTPIDNLARRMILPDEDQQADFYDLVCQRLGDMGFQHYEISNFAKPGFECRHNKVYWQCGDYLGLGPAAHGRVGLQYWSNHAQLSEYCQAVASTGLGRVVSESWTQARLKQEQVIQGLRLSQGIPIASISKKGFEKLREALEYGLLENDSERVRLTQKGRLLANEVFMLLVEQEYESSDGGEIVG